MHNNKILWITERFPPLGGGMAESAWRQVCALRKRGFWVDVLIFKQESGPVAIQRLDRDQGIDIIISHQDEPGNASQRAWRELLSRHKVQPYCLVLGFGAGFPGYLAVTYGAWLDLPVVVSVRGNDFDRDWFEPKKAFFVHEALKRADSIGVVSIEKVDKIKALFPNKKVFFTPNGINPDMWSLLPDEESRAFSIRKELNGNGRRVIGLFGELKYKKRIPMWLSSLREAGLADRISLLVTGKVDAETQAVLSDPALAPLNKVIPFCSQDALPPLYAACDFITIPSLFEGFPNVLLEAMSAGVIPIVSDAGAMGDVLTHGETGFLFTPEDRFQAGRATSEALTLSDQDLLSMKTRVKEYVKKHFSLEKEADILEQQIIQARSERPRKID